jgi:GNAT superfamily N-acetyltransferase
MTIAITYQVNMPVTTEEVIDVFRSAGLNRPVQDKDRIALMLQRADLTVTAWHEGQLVGIARSLTDYCYCCYLSDLAVRQEYQHQGIGKKLVDLTKQEVGDNTCLLLLAAPSAMEYYPKIGMSAIDNAFLIRRTA